MPELSTLYRPVGQRELELVRESGFRRFPSRLPTNQFSILYSTSSTLRKLLATGIGMTKHQASRDTCYVSVYERSSSLVMRSTVWEVRSTRNTGYLRKTCRILMTTLSESSKSFQSSAPSRDRGSVTPNLAGCGSLLASTNSHCRQSFGRFRPPPQFAHIGN